VSLPSSAEALEEAIAAVTNDAHLAQGMLLGPWRLLPKMSGQQAVQLLLELVHYAPDDER
jgi:hypothetical protein